MSTEVSLHTPRNNVSISSYGRVDVFRDVCKGIPQNEYGLPIFVYRPDLIPEDFFQLDDLDQASILGASSVELQYHEGFPTFDDGISFWGQMPHEPDQAYYMFCEYRNQVDTIGIRRIESLFDEPKQFARGQLQEFHTNYFWSPRCKAFDLFRVAANMKLRERRIMTSTDQHFLKAEKLLGKLSEYFDKVDDDGNLEWIAEMGPKTAIDALDKLIKIQRTAAGLSAHGHAGSGKDSGGAPANASVEVALRTIAKASEDPNATDKDGSAGQDLALLLNDPDTAARAQELIVRFNA